MRIVLYTDGGCSGNNQTDTSKRKMVSVVCNQAGDVLVDKHSEGGSNNIAELIAVKEALLWCVVNGYHRVEIRTDSKNNFAWVLGNKVGEHINDRDWVLALKAVMKGFLTDIKLKLVWVGRDFNVAGYYIEQKYKL